MKLLIGFTAILSCYLMLGIVLSCSYKPKTVIPAPTDKTISAEQQKELESVPPIVVQQFGGCKAHR
jgi:hypothetical protein